jgi:excisionase family DNA binding protein
MEPPVTSSHVSSHPTFDGATTERALATLSHIAAALVAHTRRLQSEGAVPPPVFTALTQLLLECVRMRHDATALYAAGIPMNDPDMTAPLLVTKREAARLLSVSMRTVERLIAAGRLPVVQVEGASRIRVDDLRGYVDRLTVDVPGAVGQQLDPASRGRSFVPKRHVDNVGSVTLGRKRSSGTRAL